MGAKIKQEKRTGQEQGLDDLSLHWPLLPTASCRIYPIGQRWVISAELLKMSAMGLFCFPKKFTIVNPFLILVVQRI